MRRIDAHIHFEGDEPDSLALLERLNLKLLNICWVDEPGTQWRTKAEVYKRLAQTYPEHYAWCTSFDLPRFDDPNYIDQVISGIERDFHEGAVACKVWKNIGMEVRKPSGELLMVDDPFLEPIFDYLAGRNKTLLAHIGEPRGCWEPLVPGTPHYGYYSKHPQWHMLGRSDMASHGELIAARDNLIAQHPNLRVVGAHLGSLEYDVEELGTRFDRYSNFAVDTSARLLDLTYQDPEKVRRWFIDYQDRILFGTDLVLNAACSAMPPDERAAALKETDETYSDYFRFLESIGKFDMQGREVTGLELPSEVLDKVYFGNARRWYPDLNEA